MKKASRPHAETVACSCSAIRRAARRATQFYDRALAPAGLRITQYALLNNVARAGPISMTALAGALDMDRTTLTRNIAPLARENVLSLRDSGHGRTKLVDLTARGRAMLERARPYWREAQEQFARTLGAEGTRNITGLIDAMNATDLG